MQRTDLDAYSLPDTPGVYFFLGANKDILYIGKATSLRNRVRSYFATDLEEKRSELIANMVAAATSIEWTETDSVLEALILETNLIRTHKPKYNTRSKDDKSYNHLVITNEEWPRVLVVRGKDLTERFTAKEIKYHFGPFPSGQLFREALKIVRRLFKFYDTKRPVQDETSKFARGKIDFNRQIGLYPESHEKPEYDRAIRHIRLFFQGRKKQVIKELQRDMMAYAKREQFEAAEQCKRRIFALEHIQDIALIKADYKSAEGPDSMRIEAYDIAHLAGKDMVGVMTVVENGGARKNEYRKFKIKGLDDANDPAALQEVLDRRLAHPEWSFPRLIVVDGGVAQKRAAELIVQKHALAIPVVAVVKDERHKPVRVAGSAKFIDAYKQEILLANAESHRFAIAYYRDRSRKRLTK